MRAIDNTRIRARHIHRSSPLDPGAVEVLPGHWWAPSSGLDGRNGWQSATVERRLSDHGVFSGLKLPNAAGGDGALNRRRFAVRTDPTYRLGNEWVEFADADTGRPLFVGTPESADVDGASVTVSGVDAGGLLSGWREGHVAPWTPHAPQDVIDWYSRCPVQLRSDDFRDGDTHDWQIQTGGPATVTPTDQGLAVSAKGAGTPTAVLTGAFPPTEAGGAWSVSVTGLIGTANVGGGVNIQVGSTVFTMAYSNALGGTDARLTMRAYAPGAGDGRQVYATAACPPFAAGDTIQLELVAIDGWIIFLRDGQLIGQLRRAGTGLDPVSSVSVIVALADFTLVEARARCTRAFLRRAAPAADYRVAGVPAPTPGGETKVGNAGNGLRGEYYLTYDQWVRSGGDFARYGAQILGPLAEPYARRLDAVINFSGAPPTWQPPGPPNGEGFAVRWSGAIYLDLDSTDIRLRVTDVDDMARVWVGPTTADAPYIDRWGVGAAGTGTGPWLRARLGLQSGWFPIVIEYAQGPNGGAGLKLEYDTTPDVTPPWWKLVPRQLLSPYGCWDGTISGESHREAIESVSAAMGIVWRIQPRTLESGEFPGRLEHGPRLGVDTDKVLGEDEATEYASQMSAGETVDHIVADAAGLGDNLGREGLSAEIVDPVATSQPWVSSRYEQLGEITEETMLRQRLSSLLALYTTPGETIAARPRGQSQLVARFNRSPYGDVFPVVGDAVLFDWEPDDAILVALPSIDVEDTEPRRITSVSWPLTPDGRGAPAVGFRQRPKHLRATMQRLMRQTAVQRRNYQGQLAQITGTNGSTEPGAATDRTSRLGIPGSGVAQMIARVTLVSGTGTLIINGTAAFAVTQPGDYDVTAWIVPGNNQYARIDGAPHAELSLAATIRV